MFNYKSKKPLKEGELSMKISETLIVKIEANGKLVTKIADKCEQIGITTNPKFSHIIIYCNNYSELDAICKIITNMKIFDIYPMSCVKIFSENRQEIYDSVTEKKLQESANEISGDFITDFTYCSSDHESTMDYSPAEMAKIHVKWLSKQGLSIMIEEKRYCFQYTIHYEGKKQYEALIKWLAWDFGYSENINNGCPKSERQGLEDIIAKGKWTTF